MCFKCRVQYHVNGFRFTLCTLSGLSESRDEVGDELLEGRVRLGCDLSVLGDGAEEALVAGLDVLGELLLESRDLGGVQFVEVTAHTAVDDGDLSSNKLVMYIYILVYR